MKQLFQKYWLVMLSAACLAMSIMGTLVQLSAL